MKYTIILLLTLLIVTKEGENPYSINPFIEYLQENGYYELINDVKCKITTDVAIEVCEMLVESGHCEEVTRIYMICNTPRRNPNPHPSLPPADILISILDSYNMPHDKFERLIIKLRLKPIINKSEIKPQNKEEKIIERNDY